MIIFIAFYVYFIAFVFVGRVSVANIHIRHSFLKHKMILVRAPYKDSEQHVHSSLLCNPRATRDPFFHVERRQTDPHVDLNIKSLHVSFCRFCHAKLSIFFSFTFSSIGVTFITVINI